VACLADHNTGATNMNSNDIMIIVGVIGFLAFIVRIMTD
jgi:hypothetical protein